MEPGDEGEIRRVSPSRCLLLARTAMLTICLPHRKDRSEFLDPCQEAAARSIRCLHRNGGDRSLCSDYFQSVLLSAGKASLESCKLTTGSCRAYRDCKKAWVWDCTPSSPLPTSLLDSSLTQFDLGTDRETERAEVRSESFLIPHGGKIPALLGAANKLSESNSLSTIFGVTGRSRAVPHLFPWPGTETGRCTLVERCCTITCNVFFSWRLEAWLEHGPE